MIISFDNSAIKDLITEEAHLVSDVAAGSSVTITVDDNNGFADNDYVIVGALFEPQTELVQIDQAVTLGQDIRVDTLTFGHNPNDQVQKIGYNQVKMYSAATPTSTKTLVDTKTIDVDQRYTEFEVSDGSVLYYFFTLYNAQEAEETGYSAAINAAVSSTDIKKRTFIRQFIEAHYPYDIEDEKIQIFMDIVLNEVYMMRKWRFREAKTTFSFTSGTYEYDIVDDLNITDFGQLVSAQTPTIPLKIISSIQDDKLALATVINTPHTIAEWAGKLYVRVPSSQTITIKYYKRPEALLTAGDETAMTLSSTIAYGVLRHLYANKDKAQSDHYRNEYISAIEMMKKDDQKNTSIHSLPICGEIVTGEDITPSIT
jgi:hypothetical protein